MTDGLLLDTHTLLWRGSGAAIRPEARFAMGGARAARHLYFSHISYWEIGVSQLKKPGPNRPDLRGLPVESWFTEMTFKFALQALSISGAIAIETGAVPSTYGLGDPGDCFLIASARMHNLSLVTRDNAILQLAQRLPGYIDVIEF